MKKLSMPHQHCFRVASVSMEVTAGQLLPQAEREHFPPTLGLAVLTIITGCLSFQQKIHYLKGSPSSKQFQQRALKTDTIVTKERELHLCSPKQKVFFYCLLLVCVYYTSPSTFISRFSQFWGGPKPSLALLVLSSEMFHTEAVHTLCMAGSAHPTLVLGRVGSCDHTSTALSTQKHRRTLNTLGCFIPVPQVMPAQSAGDQSLCLHPKDGSHSLGKAAVSPHPDVQRFKLNDKEMPCFALAAISSFPKMVRSRGKFGWHWPLTEEISERNVLKRSKTDHSSNAEKETLA